MKAHQPMSLLLSAAMSFHLSFSLVAQSCCFRVDAAATEVIWSHLEFEHSENRMNQLINEFILISEVSSGL